MKCLNQLFLFFYHSPCLLNLLLRHFKLVFLIAKLFDIFHVFRAVCEFRSALIFFCLHLLSPTIDVLLNSLADVLSGDYHVSNMKLLETQKVDLSSVVSVRLRYLKVAIPTALLAHILTAKVAPMTIPFTFEDFSAVRAYFGLQASGNTTGKGEDRIFLFENVLLSLGYENLRVNRIVAHGNCACLWYPLYCDISKLGATSLGVHLFITYYPAT